MRDRILFVGEPIPSGLSDFFTKSGFDVESAPSHEDAFHKVEESRFAVVFCNINSLDELDFITELRSRFHSSAPIFVTGPDQVAFAMKAVQNGARYYWAFPVDMADVERYFSDGSHSLVQNRLSHQRESTLLQIIKEIALTMELDGLVNILMDSAMELTGADGGALMLRDEKSGSLVMKAVRGVSGNENRSEFFGLPEKQYYDVLESRQPVFLTHFSHPVLASNKEEVGALIIAPIWHKEEALGLLVNVKFRNGEQPLSDDDFKLITLLCQEISGAVHNAITHYKTKELTIKDDLTDAYNRRYFERYLEEEFMRARRYGANLSVIFFDVDNLKEVNAKHGHLIGSKTLQEIAHRMILTVRGIDKVVRYGGDEFCVVLPETDTQGAFQVADRIRTTIANKPFSVSDTIQVNLTGSMGVASFPTHAASKEELVRQADKAMFIIKNRTKNAIGIAEPLGE
jgi:diguanylate cyclase (GGDEF)-like protein